MITPANQPITDWAVLEIYKYICYFPCIKEMAFLADLLDQSTLPSYI